MSHPTNRGSSKEMTIYMRRLDDIDAFWSKEWSNAKRERGA